MVKEELLLMQDGQVQNDPKGDDRRNYASRLDPPKPAVGAAQQQGSSQDEELFVALSGEEGADRAAPKESEKAAKGGDRKDGQRVHGGLDSGRVERANEG